LDQAEKYVGGGLEAARGLLGGKGANLAEMTRIGLPVPPGFTVTTEACNAYLAAGNVMPEGSWEQMLVALAEVERLSGKKFGDAKTLLVSCRSGAKFSMPGMMETILNVGLTDKCIDNYIKRHNNQEAPKKFILDCYRRLYEMFGQNVYGMDKVEFRNIFDNLKKEVGMNKKILC